MTLRAVLELEAMAAAAASVLEVLTNEQPPRIMPVLEVLTNEQPPRIMPVTMEQFEDYEATLRALRRLNGRLRRALGPRGGGGEAAVALTT